MPEIETVGSVAAPTTRRTRKPSGDSPPKAKRARGRDDDQATPASTTPSPTRRSRQKRSAASAAAADDPAATPAEANPFANAAGAEAPAGDEPDARAIEEAVLGAAEEQDVRPGAMPGGDEQPVGRAVGPMAGAASVEDTGTDATSPHLPREPATGSAPAPLPIPPRPAVGRSRPAPPTFKQTVLSAAAERFRGDMVRQPVTEQQVDQMLVLLHRRGPSTSLRSSTYDFLRRGMSQGNAEVQIEKLRAAVVPGDVRAAA